MRALFIAGREPSLMTNQVILKGLKQNGVEVTECASEAGSYLYRYPHVLSKFFLTGKKSFDFIYISYFGQPLVPIFKKLTDRPLIFDAHISGYDTMCFDRKKFKPDSLAGRLLYWLDKRSCELADKVLLDTNSHIDYFVETFNLDRRKFERVFVGADDSILYPRELREIDGTFRVFHYSTYHPLHGVEHIVRAAHELESYEDIEFEILGRGMEYQKIRRLAAELKVRNVRFIEWIPHQQFYDEVTKMIARADICLGGHFADVGKAKRVISGKTFEFIAMKKAVIVGDNLANKELFQNKGDVFMVEMANAGALAGAILDLRNNPYLLNKLEEKGFEVFKRKCTPLVIGAEIKAIAQQIINRRQPSISI